MHSFQFRLKVTEFKTGFFILYLDIFIYLFYLSSCHRRIKIRITVIFHFLLQSPVCASICRQIIIGILLDNALSAPQPAPIRAEAQLFLQSDSTVAPKSRGHVQSPGRDPDTAILHVDGLLTAFRKRLVEVLVAVTLQT
jgi:hypothetical protein